MKAQTEEWLVRPKTELPNHAGGEHKDSLAATLRALGEDEAIFAPAPILTGLVAFRERLVLTAASCASRSQGSMAAAIRNLSRSLSTNTGRNVKCSA